MTKFKIISIIIILVAGVYFWGLYANWYKSTDNPIKILVEHINITPVPTTIPLPTTTPYPDPDLDPTMEAENDEMVAEGIKASENEYAMNRNDNHRNFYTEIKNNTKKCEDINDEQASIDIFSKPIDKVKAMRAKVEKEIVKWYDIRNNMSEDQLEINYNDFWNYTNDVTIILARIKLLEDQCGIWWNRKAKKYEEAKNEY